MESLLAGGGLVPPGGDPHLMDTSEQIQISALALLKMLKHGTFFHSATHLSILELCLITNPYQIYLFFGVLRKSGCSHGSHGLDVGRVCR